MGQVRHVESVIAFCAVISRHADAFPWARERLETLWGALGESSPPMPFEASGYYTREMGPDLKKILVAAEQPRDPAELPRWKLATNRLEREYAAEAKLPEVRPLNLDPGYLSQSKLVLATVKDRDHRVYLGEGIFGEVTLRYRRSGWTDNPWTYPSYRAAAVKEFAGHCRSRLREWLAAEDGLRR